MVTRPNSKLNTDNQQVSLPHFEEGTESVANLNVEELRRELVELEAILEHREEREFLQEAA